MRVEEQQVWTTIGAIKAAGKEVAQATGELLQKLEAAGLVRSLPSRTDMETVESMIEPWVCSQHFVKQYGEDLETVRLFCAAAEHENRRTSASYDKLIVAEENYYFRNWTDIQDDMRADERALARAS